MLGQDNNLIIKQNYKPSVMLYCYIVILLY